MKREIQYHIFIECSKHTDDGYWKCIFEDLAYGRAPYGSNINKGFIYSNYKGKEFSYKIEEKDSLLIYEELRNIFTKKLNLQSIEDKSKNKIDIQEDNIISMDWNTIKKKNIKDYVIEDYVITMMKQFSLTLKQVKKLLSIINIGLTFKKIINEDIVFDKGKIREIKGISFQNKQIQYEIKIYDFTTNSKEYM